MASQQPVGTRRSDAWFHDPDMYGFVRRAFAKSMGYDDADLARPIIGIAQTQSDLNNCNNNFRELAEYVKRGVWQAGGTPLEFPTISLGELFMQPDDHAVPQPDGHGHRGDDPRPSAGRRRAARQLRQDHAGAADGRGQRQRAGASC